MELPDELVEACAPVEPDTVRVRNTRSAQRRRSAQALPTASVAEEPVAALPDVLPAAPEPEPSEASPASASMLPDPAPAVDTPADPVPVNPPAAVMADISTEDHVMDTINTAETIADTATDTAEQMAGRGQAVFADLNGRAKAAMEKTGHMVEEMGAFGKGNMEALVESSKIAAKGMETLGQEAADFTRRSFESATAAMKTLAATRSPTEFMKLQGDYARSMFDAMIAETSKSTEMMLKLANEVAQPISNRVAIAADKMKVAA